VEHQHRPRTEQEEVPLYGVALDGGGAGENGAEPIYSRVWHRVMAVLVGEPPHQNGRPRAAALPLIEPELDYYDAYEEDDEDGEEAGAQDSEDADEPPAYTGVTVDGVAPRRPRRHRRAKRLYGRVYRATGDYESSTESDSVYETSSDAGGGGEDGGLLRDDPHFQWIEKDYCGVRENWEAVHACYTAYRRYAPLPLCTHRRPFADRELTGLEYLLNEAGRRVYETLQFPRLLLGEAAFGGCGALVARHLPEPTRDTFIVSRLCDYVFGHVIERALLDDVRAEQMPKDVMNEARIRYRERKLAAFPLCSDPRCLTNEIGAERCCPLSLLIYTRRDSEFFLTCQRLMDSNTLVYYERHLDYFPQLPLSYHLVHYLCGHLMGATQPALCQDAAVDEKGVPEEGGGGEREAPMMHVERYDQWIAVRITLLDLWRARK